MFRLEKYKGTKSRHTCPACNFKGVFVRYVADDGNYLSEAVGRCNRESKCGYHKSPKECFADNPTFRKFAKGSRQTLTIVENLSAKSVTCFDFIAPEHLTATLGNYEQNAFVQFLLNLFPNDSEDVQKVLKMYFVGTFEDYICFPSIDQMKRVCRAKLIRFNQTTGKRLKGDYDTSSLVRKLKLKENFQYKQIFFGEHLLSREVNKPIAIVEAEKTAIIASLCFPEKLWLATGSKQWLKVERLQRLGQRQIILYPDADGFELWQGIASDAQKQGLTIKASSEIENFATDGQKQNQYDLADYLIEQQKEINAHNEFIDFYNAKLETVLNDESLKQDFETILDEQKAVLIIDRGLSDAQAEKLCAKPENIRALVLSV